MLALHEVLNRFGPHKQHGAEYRVRCPAHDDTEPSLDIREGDSSILFQCRSAKCQTAAILRAAGLTWADVTRPVNGAKPGEWDAEHEYRDAAGELKYTVYRRGSGPGKVIRQRQANGEWSMKGVQPIPYRLPELYGQTRVFVVEGEKCVDRLWSIGIPATCNVGGAKKWRASDTAALKAAGVAQVVIVPDNDTEGKAHADLVCSRTEGSGIGIVRLAPLESTPKADVVDWLDHGHVASELDGLVATALARTAVIDPSTWGFTTLKNGTRMSNLENISIALSNDPALAELVWYDEFLDRLMTRDRLSGRVREWRDDDDVWLAIYLQSEHRLHTASPGQAHSALEQRATQTPTHCVRDWLRSLVWDKTLRVKTAIETYWGAVAGDDQPVEYLEAVSANFFVSMIARVMQPGCKVDTMPVFEGPQGIFKSSALEILGGAWHIVSHESFSQKDFFQVLPGAWLVELSELDSVGRAEVTRIKSVLSTRIDRYRKSYARSATDHPRQCVFAGTTNADAWGRDETGLRRFWPIRCGAIDCDALRADRDQLLAEAVALFDAGVTWWSMPRVAEDVQADRQSESVWVDELRRWLTGKTETTILEVARDGLKIETGKVTRSIELEAARALRLLGWERVRRRVDGSAHPRKVWIPKDESASFEL